MFVYRQDPLALQGANQDRIVMAQQKFGQRMHFLKVFNCIHLIKQSRTPGSPRDALQTAICMGEYLVKSCAGHRIAWIQAAQPCKNLRAVDPFRAERFAQSSQTGGDYNLVNPWWGSLAHVRLVLLEAACANHQLPPAMGLTIRLQIVLVRELLQQRDRLPGPRHPLW